MTWPTAWRLLLPDGVPPPDGHPLVLALHGYGHDGASFAERLAPLRGLPYALALPDAPFPVTVERDGRPPRIGRSWYAYDGDQVEFRRTVDFLVAHLERVLDQIFSAARLDRRRVVVLGYSQGGYLASLLALRQSARFCGLVAISCRVKVEWFGEDLRSAAGFPVLGVHGRSDEFTLLAPQQRAFESLRSHGIDADLRVFEGGHALTAAVLDPVAPFLRRVLGEGT